MQVKFDSDVQDVIEFMERTVPPEKLRGVANRVAEAAGLLWDHFDPEDVAPMQVVRGTDPRALNILQPNEISRLAASEFVPVPECVRDGSGAATACP